MIFNPPGTHKYTIQAWLKDSVEVKAERVEPQRVVLHPGGHDQDYHLLIAQLDASKRHGKSNQWSRERLLWIYLNTGIWLPDGLFGCSGVSSTFTFEQHCMKLEAENKFGFSADQSFYINFSCQFQWLHSSVIRFFNHQMLQSSCASIIGWPDFVGIFHYIIHQIFYKNHQKIRCFDHQMLRSSDAWGAVIKGRSQNAETKTFQTTFGGVLSLRSMRYGVRKQACFCFGRRIYIFPRETWIKLEQNSLIRLFELCTQDPATVSKHIWYMVS